MSIFTNWFAGHLAVDAFPDFLAVAEERHLHLVG